TSGDTSRLYRHRTADYDQWQIDDRRLIGFDSTPQQATGFDISDGVFDNTHTVSITASNPLDTSVAGLHTTLNLTWSFSFGFDSYGARLSISHQPGMTSADLMEQLDTQLVPLSGIYGENQLTFRAVLVDGKVQLNVQRFLFGSATASLLSSLTVRISEDSGGTQQIAGSLSEIREIIEFDGEVHVLASDVAAAGEQAASPSQLYRLDDGEFGPEAVLVGDLGTAPRELTEFNGQLYYSAVSNSGRELWRFDGVAAEMVADIHRTETPIGSSNPNGFLVYEGVLLFQAAGGRNVGRELYRFDGEHVALVEDVVAGDFSSAPTELTVLGDDVFLFGNVPNDYPGLVLADQPVGYWRLGENSTSQPLENLGSLGQADDGEYRNDPLLGIDAQVFGDTAARFNRLDDDDEVRIEKFAMPTDAVTVEFWMRTTATNQGAMISYAVGNGVNANEFLIANPSGLEIYINGNRSLTGISVNDGNWHHIAVSYDTSERLFLYVDGVERYRSLTSGAALTTDGMLIFGQDQDRVGGDFDPAQAYRGDLDEVAIYDRVLTPSEVARHFNTRTLIRYGYPGNHGYVFSGAELDAGGAIRGDGTLDHQQSLTSIRGGVFKDSPGTMLNSRVVGDVNGDGLEDIFVADPALDVKVDGPAVVTGVHDVRLAEIPASYSATLRIQVGATIAELTLANVSVTSLSDLVGQLNDSIDASDALRGKIVAGEMGNRLSFTTIDVGPEALLEV
ncbi:MAG: LamG-like jellyroll fold domain-containing protein, partial [Planctomycetota bacterium]